MVGNIIILLVVIGLTVLFGWLTYRAVRAKKLWVKIVGGLSAGLLTLVIAAVTFLGGKGVAAIYFPDAPPAPDLAVAGTPEQIARGEYLVAIACMGCHTQVGADGNPSRQHPLSGGWNLSEADGFGFIGDMVTENLTPGGKLAGYSDGELFRGAYNVQWAYLTAALLRVTLPVIFIFYFAQRSFIEGIGFMGIKF